MNTNYLFVRELKDENAYLSGYTINDELYMNETGQA
jgi:hypothetical protein